MKTKELLLLALVFFAFLPLSGQSVGNPDGDQNRDRIIFGGSVHKPKLIDVEPEGWYYCDSRMLTIEFPTTGFVPYTLSISSELNTLDYYITSPLTSVYISPEVVEVDVQLATDGGDLYYASFEATSNTLSE